ncbi:hypothetical protein OQA88_9443 [Cercophora sp. LCS_1]
MDQVEQLVPNIDTLNLGSARALQAFTEFLRAEIQRFLIAQAGGQAEVRDWLPGLNPSDVDSLTKNIAAIGKHGVVSFTNSSRPTLDAMYTELVRSGVVSDARKHREDIIQLLFFLFGRLTMPYHPKISSKKLPSLGIHIEGHDCFENDAVLTDEVAKRPIAEAIHKFGLELLDETAADHDPHEPRKFLDSRLLNADQICNVANVSIEWTTSIFSHLSFNESKRQLSLFALPSFCLLHSQTSLFTRLHNLLCEGLPEEDLEASQESVRSLLGEVLLSYHLLFGNGSRSRARKVFKKYKKRCRTAAGQLDPLLLDLCAKVTSPYHVLDTAKIGKSSYSGSGDFPTLYNRLKAVQDFVSMEGPKKAAHLWRNRGDLNMAYTFRAVIVFGLISVCLSITQTGLAIWAAFLAKWSYGVAIEQLRASCPCESKP